MIIGVSEDLAQIEGISVKKNSLIFIFSLAIIVALGVKLVGALLTIALVSIPAASAKNLSWSLKSFTVFSFLFGILAPLFGISFAKLFAMPAGILTILISAVFFLITVFFQKNDK
jgi:ABC-type Mn2+/Zn2+ transport system permease subunit